MKLYDLLEERKKTAYPLGPAVTDFFPSPPLRVTYVFSLTDDFYMANVLNPPSTTATVPVTNAAASLIR